MWGDDLFGEHMMSVTHKKNAEVTTCNEWEGALALTNRLQPLMSYVNEGLTDSTVTMQRKYGEGKCKNRRSRMHGLC